MRLLVLILCLSVVTSLFAERSVIEQDSLALVAFYEATSGDGWIRNDNWRSGAVKDWYGVNVDNERVTALILSANNLSGYLPGDLGTLDALKHIFISYNQLSGQIPEAIANLKQLQMLWAQFNAMSGQIPQSIGGLDSLKTLNLGNNQFSGSLPEEIGTLSKLENLNLQFNHFDSVLPDALGNLSELKYLFLNNNEFSGAVPVSFQSLARLTMASFNDNYFSDLPDLSGISSLDVSAGAEGLQVQNNRLDFVDIQPNMTLFSASSDYAPQRLFGTGLDIVVQPGDTLAFDIPGQTIINATDTNTIYTYKQDGVQVQESHSTVYDVNPVTLSHLGTYTCYATDAEVPGLTLQMESVKLRSEGDSTWLSIGTYLDGNLVDTIAYELELYEEGDNGFESIVLTPQVRAGRCEMLIGEGDYYIKIVPESDSYMVRYCSNTNQWQKKAISKAKAGGSLSFNSHFVRQKESSGSGVVSGTISKAENGPVSNEFSVMEGERGDAFSGADIYLFDATQSKFLRHSRSTELGAYEFENLDFGTYQIIIDYPGYTMETEFVVNVNASMPMIEQKSFTLVDLIASGVGIEDVKNHEEELMVYPNPTQGMIFVKGSFVEGKLLTYTLFDLNGRSVISATINSYASVAGIELDRNRIDAGMYLLEMNNGQEHVSKRIMIK